MTNKELSRRDFLNIAALSAGAIGLRGVPKGFLNKDGGTYGSEIENTTEKGLEVLKIVEYEGIVKASNLPIVFAPLRNDYFYDEKRDIELWNIKNISFGINKIFYLKDDKNMVFRVATLHHNAGDQSLPIAILDEGQIDYMTQEYWPFRKYGQLSKKEDIAAEFSLIGEYYPNKTHNLLEAAAQLLRYQIEHGPFEKDKTYSALDILNIKGNYNYKYGKETYLGYSLRGDGICGMTTALAHTLSQANVRFDEHRGHSYWTKYWIGPLDPNISIENDTAISSFEGTNRDFKWTPLDDKPLYLSIQSVLAKIGPATRNLTEGANSRIFFQLMLRENKPDLHEELVQIEKLQEAYENYNRGWGVSEQLLETSLVNKMSWGTGSQQESLITATYAEEDTSGFEKEISENQYLQDIIELKNLVCEYIKKYPDTALGQNDFVRVGSFIKKSEWYESLISNRKTKLEKVLKYLDDHTYRYYTIKNQHEAVQCVGWTMLLASLGYDNSPINVHSHPAVFARDLIPNEFITQDWRTEMISGKYKYIVPESLSDINNGDLFVTHELPFESSTGHVGVVVNKKTTGNETTFLVSDSNRKCDGAPRLFKVDRANAHAIFGRPPKRWVVVRKLNK